MFKQLLFHVAKLMLLAALLNMVVISRLHAQQPTPTPPRHNAFAGLADWDADGHQDIVARDWGGLLWLYPGDSSRGYSQEQRVQIGNGLVKTESTATTTVYSSAPLHHPIRV